MLLSDIFLRHHTCFFLYYSSQFVVYGDIQTEMDDGFSAVYVPNMNFIIFTLCH
jgi:hypothetical protein